MKIVFITGQLAPFQLETARAVNRLDGITYKVLFSFTRSKRPAHWLNFDRSLLAHALQPPAGMQPAQVAGWINQVLHEERPDVVLAGGIRGLHPAAALRYRRESGNRARVGLWMEPPNITRNPLLRLAKTAEYCVRLRRVEFVLAIGIAAQQQYSRCQPKTYLVPYGEDLSACLAVPRRMRDNGQRLVFLFSGRLEARHNFPVIMEAFARLLRSHGPCFEFVVAGHGPAQQVIDAWVEREPGLRELIRYDRDYETWDDRLRPFMQADVFVYPTDYAGWGLVIPEAMAAGQLVIASRAAEAARHLVEHERNGLFVEPVVDDLYRAFVRCVENRAWVHELGLRARQAARRGDAPQVAELLVRSIRRALGQWQGA